MKKNLLVLFMLLIAVVTYGQKVGLDQLRFTVTDTEPAAIKGYLYFDDSEGTLKQYDGTSWVPVGDGDVTAASAFGTDDVMIKSDGTGKGVQATTINVTDGNAITNVSTFQSASGIFTSTLTATAGAIVRYEPRAEPVSTPFEGQMYWDDTANTLKQYNGSAWEDVGSSSTVWGAITGTLSDQTDLQTALDGKVSTTGDEDIGGIKTFTSTLHNNNGKQNYLLGATNGYVSGGAFGYAGSSQWFLTKDAVSTQARLDVSNLTANRVFTFPDVAGTIALTTGTGGLSDYLPLAGGTMDGNILSSGDGTINIGAPANRFSALYTEFLDVDFGTSIYIGSNVGNNDDESNNVNVGLGYQALELVTSGSRNIAIGQSALGDVTTTGDNVAIGANALTLYTGTNNTAVGSFALDVATTGSNNVAIGVDAGGQLLTGQQNVFIGSNSGDTDTSPGNTTTTGATFIGYDTSTPTDGTVNETIIGNQAVGNGSNTVTIGNSSVTDNHFSGKIHSEELEIIAQGTSVKNWEIRTTTINDDLAFIAESGADTDSFTPIIATINDSGTPTEATDLIDKAYADANYGGGGGLANVVEDTSPELGGDLVVGIYDINSTGNLWFNLDTDNNSTTSGFNITQNGVPTAIFSFDEDLSMSLTPTDVEPTGTEGMLYWDNSENTLKQYNGTSWEALNGGGGTFTGTIADTQIAFGDTSTDNIGGSANLTWDGSQLDVVGSTTTSGIASVGSLQIEGSTSGTVTLDVPAVAGSNTITVPAVTGTMATTMIVETVSSSITMDGFRGADDQTADTASFTVDGTVAGGTYQVVINRATAPTITGATQLSGSEAFIANTKMILTFIAMADDSVYYTYTEL